ncbi:MAG: hypothetical protein HC892_13835 [Saprospiraceae bacterium]|nr:hypothetical protein [Saprospiraceae bacterium]
MLAQKDLPTESVEIIRNFDARLLDSEKIDIPPSLPPIDTTTKRQRYNIPAKTLSIPYPPPRIRPLALQTDPQSEAYKGYLKAGGGFPNSFYTDAAYHVFAQEKMNVGLNFNHHSASNSSNLENQRFAYSKVAGEGTFYNEQGLAVNGKLAYTSDNVFFYGYNAELEEGDTTSIPKEQVKQTFSIFDVSAKVFNGTRTAGDINYSAGVDFYTMGDASPTTETGFKLGVTGEKWFANAHPFRLNLITDFTRYSTTTDSSQRLNNYFLQPNFTYRAQNFRIKVGANIASSDDEFSIFPDLELSANVIESILTIFVGADGDLKKNNFRNLTNYNPFLSSRVVIKNTRYNNYYVGAKGSIQGITYRGEFAYKDAQDLALFLDTLEANDQYRFNAIYDDARILNIKGTVETVVEDFKIAATLSQNIYTMEVQEKPWHLPALEVNIGLQYATLENKLRFKAIYSFKWSTLPRRKGEANTLNGLFDVNLGVEYLLQKISEPLLTFTIY